LWAFVLGREAVAPWGSQAMTFSRFLEQVNPGLKDDIDKRVKKSGRHIVIQREGGPH
jgi:hypothetical protein